MDFPKDKNFMYVQDNGDDTITMTVQFESEIVTMVIPISFIGIAEAYSSGVDLNDFSEELEQKTIIVPDDLEG